MSDFLKNEPESFKCDATIASSRVENALFSSAYENVPTLMPMSGPCDQMSPALKGFPQFDQIGPLEAVPVNRPGMLTPVNAPLHGFELTNAPFRGERNIVATMPINQELGERKDLITRVWNRLTK